MDEKQTSIVRRLKRSILINCDPEMILLFGSTARGDADEFSDVDLLVIMDADDPKIMADRLSKDTDHITLDKHIMVRSIEDCFLQHDIPGTIIYSAFDKGVVIFKKPSFELGQHHSKPYEVRKYEVIQREYIGQAREFLDAAFAALGNKKLFKCRDKLKFAVARAIKGLFVSKDIHPPRDTDLCALYNGAIEFLPEIEKMDFFIEELNNYCPESNDPEEILKCRELTEKTAHVVNNIAPLLESNP